MASIPKSQPPKFFIAMQGDVPLLTDTWAISQALCIPCLKYEAHYELPTSDIYLARLWLNQCGAGLAHNRANANLWKGLTDLGADVEEMPRNCSKSSQCGHCPHGCPCMHLASLSQRHSPSNFCVGTGSRCPPCYMIFMPVFLLLPSPALLRLKSWSQLYLGSYWMFC
jgi:hypothetical protein